MLSFYKAIYDSLMLWCPPYYPMLVKTNQRVVDQQNTVEIIISFHKKFFIFNFIDSETKMFLE